MPVTKTATRALRSSRRKRSVNAKIISNLEYAVRKAKSTGSVSDIKQAISFVDRALKKRVIHTNKASRIKSQVSRFLKNKNKPESKVKPSKTKASK